MAWKSPGIYYTEIDNTEYTNPAAEINTTVAIIGFAKKGPINEPTEITSWSQFKSTFGSPITGDFAPIAVRNVLSNGGTVLFVRIADESLVSQSAVVLKTEKAATDGKLIFNRTSIPSAELKSHGFYKANIKQNSATTEDDERLIYFRSPAEGYLSSYNLLEQLQASLDEYYGFSEYNFKVSTKPDTEDDNWRFFNLKFNNLVTTEGSGTSDNKIGPFAVKLTSARSTNGASFAAALNSAIQQGTVPYLELIVDSLILQKLTTDSTQSPTNKRIYLQTDNYKFGSENEITDLSGIDFENDAYFYFKETTDDGVENVILDNKTCSESIKIGDITRQVVFTIAESKLSLSTIVAALNKAFSGDGIAVKTVVDVDNDKNPVIKLLFFRTNTSASFTISGVESSNNFLKIFDDTNNVSDTDLNLSNEKPLTLCLVGSSTSSDITSAKVTPVEVSYVTESNTIKFQVTESDLVPAVKGSTVELDDPEIGSYLSQTSVTDSDANYIYVTNSNKSAIGNCLRIIPGQDASPIKAKKNSSGVIELYVPNQKDYPVISENSDTTITGEDILSLFNDLAEAYTDDTSGLEEVLYKEGTDAESAGAHARIGFIAKEYGEGTTDIGIEIYTSTSPLDETTKTHYLDIYVSGIKKESFEDISYDPTADNFIATVINQDPMNGGSSYITIVYDAGSSGDAELDIQDTANYTDTGIVYLGQELYDDSTAATTSTNLSEVSSYDYAVGNNGIVTDSTALYLDALETENSPLSNKDLYSWYILITPDNISAEVQDQAISLCEYMDDAIYIADPPEALTRKAVINWHNGRLGNSDRVSALNSNFCCTYWPWVKIYDSSSSKYVWAPPSVVMAPQFVKVDNSYAPWYAPAGETNGLIATAIDIEESPNKTDRDALYLDQNRVNPFLKLRNGNILAYGEKTCQRKNSTLTKIHTRRMLIALKKELRNSIKGYIFMPTMTENITEIKSKVTAIMESYKQGGGVDSYVVVCDGTNNTTETLQQDILNVDISCVPVGCLEQIQISLTLNKAAESTE